ncbi:MAG: hypothetical protein H7326_00550 [Bdellovibrionaceae bacterium]|nr:hypothetical protein [Pseudobdellovibrionaceae bacterium]
MLEANQTEIQFLRFAISNENACDLDGACSGGWTSDEVCMGKRILKK